MGERINIRPKDDIQISDNSIFPGGSHHSLTGSCIYSEHFSSLSWNSKNVFSNLSQTSPIWGQAFQESCLDHCLPTQLSEAAYTLLLYDELLEWSDRPLREFLTYPMQTEWQRKEHLHLAIIQNFDRGKVSSPTHPGPLSRLLCWCRVSFHLLFFHAHLLKPGTLRF